MLCHRPSTLIFGFLLPNDLPMALQHPVPDEHLKHIGDITVSFTMLELNVQAFAWGLLGAGQRTGQIVTAELSFRAVRALAQSLYLNRNGDDDFLAKLRKLMARADRAEERRNGIIHSHWAVGANAASITRFKNTAKRKSGFQVTVENLTGDQLAGFALEIKTLAHDILTLFVALIRNGKAANR